MLSVSLASSQRRDPKWCSRALNAMKPLNSQVTAQSGHGGESNYASIQGHTLVMMVVVMTIMHTQFACGHTMSIPQMAKYRVIGGDEDLAHHGASLILKSQRLFFRHASLNPGRRETHYKRSRHAILRMATPPLSTTACLEIMHQLMS